MAVAMAMAIASMGLRFFKRRNQNITQQNQTKYNMLQWGCAFSSAEITDMFKLSIPGVPLQWGCAFSSAEIKGNATMSLSADKLQWGCAFSSAEMYSTLSILPMGAVASMGLRFFKRRN